MEALLTLEIRRHRPSSDQMPASYRFRKRPRSDPLATDAANAAAAPPRGRLDDRIDAIRRSSLLVPAALILLCVSAVAVRLPGFGQPLWGDEVAAARAFNHASATHVLAAVRLRKSEPPGWYLLMWVLRRGGGLVGSTPSVQTLRLTSIAFSTGTVALVFLYARRFLGRLEAFVAAAICALGSQFVLHGAEARSYALFTFAAIAFAMLIDKTLNSTAWCWPVLLFVVTTVGCYTHYFFVATLVAGGLSLWVSKADPMRRLIAGLALAAGLAALVPWLLGVVGRLHRYTYIGRYNGHTVVSLPWNLTTGYVHTSTLVRDEQLALFLLAIAGIVITLHHPRGRLAGLCALLPPLAGAIAWAVGKPVYDPRNFMGAAPFIAIVIAAPLSQLRHRFARTAIAAVVVAGLGGILITSQLSLGRTAYDSAAHALTGAGWRYSAPIVFFGDDTWAMRDLTWSLPHHQWMVRTIPPTGTCTDVYAIIQTAAGQKWLVRQPNARKVATLPNYGSSPENNPKPVDITVAKLTHVAPTVLTLARLDGGSVFVSAPAPALTLTSPDPKPYPVCRDRG